MKTLRLLAALLVSGGLLVLSACGGDDGTSNPPAATNTAPPTVTRTPTPTFIATPTRTATPIGAPAVPDNLQVPAGNAVFLVGHAVGTQDYICLPSGAGVAWTFVEPQATLFNDAHEQIITHFLSANPAESGTARPTWQDSEDTSAVWAKKIADSSDANFVAPGAIPWFLLQVVGSQTGPSGGNTLAVATFIQRVNTSGGIAPSTGCAQSADVGSTALVSYTANYFFYKAD